MTDCTYCRFNIRAFQLQMAAPVETPNSISHSFVYEDYEYIHGLKPQIVVGAGYPKINNLPTIIAPDGTPWEHGCLYLLDKAVQLDSEMSTVGTHATDLAQFRSFCCLAEIDYLIIPKNKRKKPLSLYKKYLQRLINSGEIGDRTAARKMHCAISLYRFLQEDLSIPFDNPPFIVELTFISYEGKRGNQKFKPIVTTEERIKVAGKQQHPSDVTIQDDGYLRPLGQEEQDELFRILKRLGNTEMTLLFVLAVSTGGRIQSLLTVRHRHVRVHSDDPSQPIALAAGSGTLIDTKKDKKIVLYVPYAVNELLKTYSYSPRSQNRFTKYAEKRNLEQCEDTIEECYLFLTNQGNPYYSSNADNRKFDPHNQRTSFPTGGKVRDFIKNRILPEMKKTFGQRYHFRFHDLRATFGMNLVDAYQVLVDEGKMTPSELIDNVRVKLGHEDVKTTQGYVDYRKKIKRLSEVQANYESRILKLISLGMGK